MKDEFKEIVICKHCRKHEYWGEMRWNDGKEMCRDCYKNDYKNRTGKIYHWNDLDGKRPTIEEYKSQEIKSN